MKAVVRIIAMLALLASCEKSGVDDFWLIDGSQKGEMGTVRLSVSVPGSSWGSDSKSRFPDDVESLISGISLAIYRYEDKDDDWRLVAQKLFSSLEEVRDLELCLAKNYRYRLFAVANLWSGETDFFSFPMWLTELVDMPFVLGKGGKMSFSDVGERGIPASGSSAEIEFSDESAVSCGITLRRLFSKIIFNVDRQGYTGGYSDPTRYFSDFKIIVSHLNANLYPFRSEEGETNFTDCGETEYEMECAGVLRSNSYSFYVPANTHSLENSRCKEVLKKLAPRTAKPAGPSYGEPLDAVEPQLTKLCFRGEFRQDSGYAGTADYSLYPGGSLEPYSIDAQWYRDFDLKAGHQYSVTLSFKLSTLMNVLEPYWQLDVENFEDWRYFGLRWAQTDGAQARQLIRGSWQGDNTIDGILLQTVVARPDRPAELGLWYSTGGKNGSVLNEFDLPASERKAGCPRLGGPSSIPSNLMDNRFYISLKDESGHSSYLYSNDALKQMPPGLSMDFSSQNGKLTVKCTPEAVGKEYDCELHFLPGDNVIPFVLCCSENISLEFPGDEIYVGQKMPVSIGGAVGSYELSCDCGGKLKMSPDVSDPYLGTSRVLIQAGTSVYAWEAADAITLTFHPSDTLNDVPFTRTLAVHLPGIEKIDGDVVLTVDGRGCSGPMRYVRLDEARTAFEYEDFDPELFANTIAPKAWKVQRPGSIPHPNAKAVAFEGGGFSWYCETASGFQTSEAECGLLDVGFDASVTPPSKYYGPVGPFSAKLYFAVPKIADNWSRLTDTTGFYNSTVAADKIVNVLNPYLRMGNVVAFKRSGINSSAVQLAEKTDGLEWSFKDTGLSVSSLNSAPYGKQGVEFYIENIRDGSSWQKTLMFILYHKFTVNVCAYFAVEDKSASPGYTSRFNQSGVFLLTPRHWKLMKDIWLNTSAYWKKSTVFSENISAAGVSLSNYVLLSTSWIKRSDCYHEGSESRCYWETKESYYNFEQGYLYVSNVGRDDIWGWKESGSSKYRFQYYYGEYFNATNVGKIKPVYDAWYYDGFSRLSYDEYIMRLGNEYVVINGKTGKVFENTYTLWLGERSR